MKPDAKTYFPHVDGLRTIAVIGVLLSHFHIPGFPGGFLGVDVFFVISGYLISRLIIQERGKTGSFSFARFYLRRLRRLMPAALMVIAVSYLLFAGILSDKESVKFLKSIPFSIFSLANINFYRDVGYFDTEAQFKPLLHMWSLAVEEQFYLLWPAAMLLMLRLGRALLPFAILLLLGSVALAELLFGSNPSAAYYLLPFRAFELLVGAVLATLMADQSPDHRDIALPAPWAATAAAIGMAMIVAPYLLLDETSRMPGALSLIPCIGTALVIAYGAAGPVGRFLTWRPVVWIGLISYSLYLVHWPLIAYVAYRYPDMPPLGVRLALLPVSIALAALSYYFVEERFRHPRREGGRWREAPFLAGIGVAAVVLCLPFVWNLMYPERPAPLRAQQMAHNAEGIRTRTLPLPGSPSNASITRIFNGSFAGGPRILILGDSHTGHLRYGAEVVLASNGYVVDIAMLPACPALFDTSRYFPAGHASKKYDLNCRANAAARRALATSGKYAAVIVASRWDVMFEPAVPGTDFMASRLVAVNDPDRPTSAESRALFAKALASTIDGIHAAGTVAIIISQVPSLGNDLSTCNNLFEGIAVPPWSRCFSFPRQDQLRRIRFTDQVVGSQARRGKTLAVLPGSIFCGGSECLLDDPQTGEPLYRDSQHLTPAGSVFLFQEMDRKYGLLKFLKAASSS